MDFRLRGMLKKRKNAHVKNQPAEIKIKGKSAKIIRKGLNVYDI
jgi:hypothetical protein